jgi:anti-anti-sigma factor
VFIDSSGLGALVALRANAEQHNTSLVLTDIPGPVRRIMELGGLGNLLSNEPRESTATSTETRNTFS